jgi:hypothetical protein
MQANSNYMETGEDPVYNLALTRAAAAGGEGVYDMAAGKSGGDGEATYAMGAAGEPESAYAFAAPTLTFAHTDESSPYALPTSDPNEEYEPVYSPANGEATYTFASAFGPEGDADTDGVHEPTYAQASATDQGEPHYIMAGALLDPSSRAAGDEPVYGE